MLNHSFLDIFSKIFNKYRQFVTIFSVNTYTTDLSDVVCMHNTLVTKQFNFLVKNICHSCIHFIVIGS